MLGPLMAAKRFAAKQGVDVDYICGDARCLPFADGAFDRAFSYSTLQHFSDQDCALTLGEIARVLGSEGSSTVQMAHWAGVRSLWHQARRGFREPARFEVRYRSLPQMMAMFAAAIGPTTVSIDCFFGLGLQASDTRHMWPLARLATATSEQFKRMAKAVPALRSGADSVFLHSAKQLALRQSRNRENGHSDTKIAAVSNYVTMRFGSAQSSITDKDVAELRSQIAR